MKKILEVVKPGLLTTIQDRGRHGYQAFGMPVAGAVDEFSLRIANILVGNPEGAAALEMTLLGPKLKVLAPVKVALTGADLGARINRAEFPRWETVAVNPGDEISFTAAREGCRAYLAVAGGVDVPAILGSRATYLKAKIGGLEGRALKAGDILGAGSCHEKNIPVGTKLTKALIPRFSTPIILRVIPGPQEDHFTPAGRKTFFQSEYTVTTETDRMGCRLQGPPVEHREGADIISDGIPLGAIQIPGHGLPIVMLADRQTTGGYPKIATVCSVDINRIGQAKPGDKVRFVAISREEAWRLLRDRQKALERWKESLPLISGGTWNYQINIGGKKFSTYVEEII